MENCDDIPPWLKKLSKQNPPFDGMVHLASVMSYSPLKIINTKLFNQTFNLNVNSSLMLAKGFSAKGVANSPASIVFMGSIAGLKGQKGRCLYSASKAAISSITQSLSMELVNKNIRVNCVAPTVIIGNKAQEQFDLLPEKQRQTLDASHPSGYGTPEDVANAVAYFLTETSNWVTGTTLSLDGGFMVL